ncbi:hypothetical protein WJ0W_004630 [Paenibacillus melissococcoides]|uniref:Uncharacterized protein n=1 Tax=Paenibacillus melissococcoides TaxID=2912268 RepID=A0ABM9G6P2_9BACL|nr:MULTISPECIES: hypothetical protein [Paenibacillus]MEB9895110.1 hypothetical protein [Bacillus cereus]WII39164.1 hypothetical protein O0V01_08785 [Paenibacillus thiaminolyticus]CAH8247396.1 hypothetical protein WJ0W_004630 [Paenibacillus melissococcoides]CAH8705271.1 hypothetical protein WDD9_000919 [Paenibacillus melissococcoides]CAH8708492.1 hypothetical protein HTL2_002004 [Paenibacillus melissococcoides]
MINISDILDDATDFDREVFIAALDKHLLNLPQFVENVSRRVKQRELVMSLKKGLNADVHEFSLEEVDLFHDVLCFYKNSAETYVDLDRAAEEALQSALRKYTRRLEDFLYDLRK